MKNNDTTQTLPWSGQAQAGRPIIQEDSSYNTKGVTELTGWNRTAWADFKNIISSKQACMRARPARSHFREAILRAFGLTSSQSVGTNQMQPNSQVTPYLWQCMLVVWSCSRVAFQQKDLECLLTFQITWMMWAKYKHILVENLLHSNAGLGLLFSLCSCYSVLFFSRNVAFSFSKLSCHMT